MGPPKCWRWSRTGVKHILAVDDDEVLGDLEPGDPFTGGQLAALQDLLEEEYSRTVLQKMGFIDEEAVLGNRWKPRCGEPAPPEAPYAPTMLDLTPEEFGKIPRCIYTARDKMSVKQWKENVDKQLPGAHYGMLFPHTFEQLSEMGAPWLTKALHAAGTLPLDNRVASLKLHVLSTDACESESMGGQGMKGWLEVVYDRPHPMLHTELFCKLPFPYKPENERMRNSYHAMPDESEILFNRLCGPLAPFKLPKYYFGEFCYETTNYILISEMLKYKKLSWAKGGKDMKMEPYEIQPPITKFKDYELPLDAYEQYATCTKSQGRFVAEFAGGGFGRKEVAYALWSKNTVSFMDGIGREGFSEFCRQGGLQGAAAQGMQEMNDSSVSQASGMGALLVQFVLNAPRLFEGVATRRFFEKWWREAMEVAYYSAEINVFHAVEPDLLSMCHCNLAPDNAWYWRNAEGQLENGFLDFGGFAILNVCKVMPSSWLMAEPDMLVLHFDDLTRHFIDGYHESGGSASLTYEHVRLCFSMQFAWQVAHQGGNALQLYKIMPKEGWAKVADRWDPVVNDKFYNRNYSCAMRTALRLWEGVGLHRRFEEWKRQNAAWFPPKRPFTCPAFPDLD